MSIDIMNGSRFVVSACLAGVSCRYDGGATPVPKILDLVRRGIALPVCPEQLGGLTTPRPPCELRAGRVITTEGADVTDAFLRGAEEALTLAELFGARFAVLKTRSPSCGLGRVYDGTFSGALVPGDGLFATLLTQRGFNVLTEDDFGGLS